MFNEKKKVTLKNIFWRWEGSGLMFNREIGNVQALTNQILRDVHLCFTLFVNVLPY